MKYFYISKKMYKKYKENGVIKEDFDLEKYNEEVIQYLYQKNLDYFKHLYDEIDPNIKLDEEQIKAILCDEDYSLIIAGAGTGKTTTMASKVKYLVDKLGIEPQKILVMSYTKKATEELENRIFYDFNIPANVTTFHSLGLSYIRRIYKDHKCYVVDFEVKEQIFLKYLKERIFKDKEKIKEILGLFSKHNTRQSFLFGKYFMENYEKYNTFEDFFESYKAYKLENISNLKEWILSRVDTMIHAENPRTIKNELVKSMKEALIANYLFQNNIPYIYEKIYEELMNESRVYRPDFTIELNGEEVYIEYFGIQDTESKIGKKYQMIRSLKENYHKTHHTKHIFLDSKDDNSLLKELEIKLKNLGALLKPKKDIEIYDQLMNNNPNSQFFGFKNFLYDVIHHIKSREVRDQYYEIVYHYLETLTGVEKEECTRQFHYIDEFYHYYQEQLFSSNEYGFDFEDMIYYAYKYLDTLTTAGNEYEYVVIDEYQDISRNRYELTKKIVDLNDAKVVAVGDDWQTIYSFAGSKIEYVYNFTEFYPGAKVLHISKTYRNSQELINYSGDFIMKNESQIKKHLISEKSLVNPIQFVYYQDGEEYDTLKKLLLEIHAQNKEHKILILARTNWTIHRMFLEEELKDGLDTKVEFVGYDDLDIDGMTIHKSKGLTSDEVIVIGLYPSFPSNKSDFWMNVLFKFQKTNEPISYAEERRLFYVALTRTKNYVYLLVHENPKYRSPFVNELMEDMKKKELHFHDIMV